MTLNDLRKLKVLQTKTIVGACEDWGMHNYVVSCLDRFFSGDFGEIDNDDVSLNLADLEFGEGFVVAKYPGIDHLADELIIEAHFNAEIFDNVDANHIVVMRPNER